MKEYIRNKLACYARGMSQDMKLTFDFVNIPGNAFTEIPIDTLHIIEPDKKITTWKCIMGHIVYTGEPHNSHSNTVGNDTTSWPTHNGRQSRNIGATPQFLFLFLIISEYKYSEYMFGEV